jgi:RHS repeat-associated protein
MTCRMEPSAGSGTAMYKQTYNAENRISSIQKLRSGACADANPILETKWDFSYDGDGVRTATLITPYDETGNPQSATLTSYYPSTSSGHRFGGAYEVTGDTIRKYYSFGGQTILRSLTPETGTPSALSYFLSDHLGSVVAVTDATGALTSQQRYLPFGGVRANVVAPNSQSLITDLSYTGQRDLGMGLMDYHARFYSSALGRFIQPDSLIPNPVNPQAWNRFAYALNNPIRYHDPTGHWIESLFDIAMIGVDIADIHENGLNWGNGLSLGFDIAALILPGVPAIGAVILKGGKIGKAAVEIATHADDIGDVKKAVAAAEKLVKFGEKAKEAQSWINDILKVSTKNPRASHVVLGGFDEYIKYAAKKGHTYF